MKLTVKALRGASVDPEGEFSIKKVAAVTKLSRQTVTRVFKDRPGVREIPGRGRQMILRVPGHVLIQWLRETTKT